MKKLVQIEQSFCDVCNNESPGYYNCILCKKSFCYECSKTETKEYKHAVHFAGSGDGRYCFACDEQAKKNGDKLHMAYRQIEALRYEEAGFWNDFKKRTDEAEENLKKLQGGK